MPLTPERQRILDQKSRDYIASMERSDKSINYDWLETDRLLILEAINDWSGRKLVEGDAVRATYSNDDPCCATKFEADELLLRLHKSPVILYPVSGFILSDSDELRFIPFTASFRMTPHINNSRADAISITEASHLRNLESAMQLWVFCAAEDCMAFLFHHMDKYGLVLEEEECVAARRILVSALQDSFSIGQVWNAIWRSVKDAAALSTRQYYNMPKAAKTLPKKIDKILSTVMHDADFNAYDRPTALPMGAVLTLLSIRFGIHDAMPGKQVREKLADDAALAPRDTSDEDASDAITTVTCGTMYFHRRFTDVDRMILKCFSGMTFETEEPTWDADTTYGQLEFSVDNRYTFDGKAFIRQLFAMMNVPVPSTEDIARFAKVAQDYNQKTGRFVDESGWSGAISDALARMGVEKNAAERIGDGVCYVVSIDDVIGLAQDIPLTAGLCAIRERYAYISGNYIEHLDHLRAGDLTLSISGQDFEPYTQDLDMVTDIVEQDLESLATRIADALSTNLISSRDSYQKARLLALIGEKLRTGN